MKTLEPMAFMELEKREFGSLKRVPIPTLLIMLGEMKTELARVPSKDMRYARERVGINRVENQLLAKGAL